MAQANIKNAINLNKWVILAKGRPQLNNQCFVKTEGVEPS